MYLCKRRFITGFVPHAHGGQEVPRSAVCTWGPRRAGGIVQPKSGGLRNKDAHVANPSLSVKVQEREEPGPRAGEDRFPSSSQHSKFTNPLPLCSLQSPPVWWGRSSLFNLPIQMLISSGNTLPDTSRNNVLPRVL